MHATEVICQPALGAPSLEHPSISSTLTVGDDMRYHRRDRVSGLLNVVRMLGPGEPVRTEC